MLRELAVCALLLAGAADPKEYFTGTLERITPSHSATYTNGTSHDMYAYAYSVRSGSHLYIGVCSDRVFSGCDINFVVGMPVKFRFDKKGMYLLRDNGKEQKTKITAVM